MPTLAKGDGQDGQEHEHDDEEAADPDAEDGGRADGDNAQAADGPSDQPGKPTSKADLQKIRAAFRNTLHLCSYFYADRSLQDEMRLVSTACQPMVRAYHRSLHDQKGQARTAAC